MKKNVGTIDKVTRLLVALVLAGLYLANVVTGTLGIILLVVAVVFVLTSFIGFCPLYWPFGINTGEKKD